MTVSLYPQLCRDASEDAGGGAQRSDPSMDWVPLSGPGFTGGCVSGGVWSSGTRLWLAWMCWTMSDFSPPASGSGLGRWV